MYKLVKSRFDGMIEVEETLVIGTLQECKDFQYKSCNRGAYIDDSGLEWYTEILENVGVEN